MFRNQVDPKFDDKKKIIIKRFRVICLKIYIINCIYERTEIEILSVNGKWQPFLHRNQSPKPFIMCPKFNEQMYPVKSGAI